LSAQDNGLRRFINSLLGSHYLLPVSSIILFLILGAALYTVYMDTRFMRNQINEGFNQQQLLLARQAAGQISGALQDIQTEVGRLAQQLSTPKTNWSDRQSLLPSPKVCSSAFFLTVTAWLAKYPSLVAPKTLWLGSRTRCK